MKGATKKGMGRIQTTTRLKNRKNILRVLIDNQWHSYKEIGKKADISNVTLSDHLKELKPLLDKKKDATSKRLSALYKIKPLFALILSKEIITEIAWKEMEDQLLKGQDFESGLKSVLESINQITNEFLTASLYILANEDFREDSEVIYLVLETFVWETYKALTWKFVEAVKNEVARKRSAFASKGGN